MTVVDVRIARRSTGRGWHVYLDGEDVSDRLSTMVVTFDGDSPAVVDLRFVSDRLDADLPGSEVVTS